jgi:hypothetical protein
VVVNTFVTEPGRSPKMEFPVNGPYNVVGITPTGYNIRSRDGIQTVHSNRVIKFPRPEEFPLGVDDVEVQTSRAPYSRMMEGEEYVLDKIFDHGEASDGSMVVLVR